MTISKKQRPTQNKSSQKRRAYAELIAEISADLSLPERLFSKAIIHPRLISLLVELLASTILRPTPILFGAISSFVLVLSSYLLAKEYGYTLSGSEAIVGFIVGWITGNIIDLTLHLKGRHSSR